MTDFSGGPGGGSGSAPLTKPRRFAGPVVLAVAAGAMIWLTWLTWLDDHIDFGRELYVAWRLSLGDVLFRDVAHVSGPLSPYCNALLFRLAGPGILWLVLLNLVVAAVVMHFCYRLLTRIAGRLAAIVAGFLFVAMFGFGGLVGAGNYNYVCPYSHEMTHGIVLALAGLSRMDCFLRRGARGPLLQAGVLLGLCFLTKAEIFVAAAGAMAVLLALARAGRSGRHGRQEAGAPSAVAAFLGAASIPPVVAFGLLACAMPGGDAIRGTLGSWPGSLNREVAALFYYQKGMGLDDPAASLRAMASMLAWQSGVLALALCSCVLPWRGVRRAIGLFLAPALVAALAFLPSRDAWYDLARPLPLYLAALLLWFGARWHRSRRPADALALAFGTLGLLLLAKIPLNARVHHYGFVLGMPGVLLLAVALVGLLPRELAARGKDGTVFLALSLSALTAVAAVHLSITAEKLGRKVHVVGRGVDRFRAGSRAEVLARTLDEIQARTLPRDTLLVIPDGVMLNYLARRRSPTRYINFVPPEMILFGEDHIVDALRLHPPDHVAVVHNDTYYPYRLAFPQDYGRKLWAFAAEGYADEALIGAPPMEGRKFGVLLRRRVAP